MACPLVGCVTTPRTLPSAQATHKGQRHPPPSAHMPASAQGAARPHPLRVNHPNLLRYCRNVHPTWVKFNSKDTKES